jgi:hypothetical protein
MAHTERIATNDHPVSHPRTRTGRADQAVGGQVEGMSPAGRDLVEELEELVEAKNPTMPTIATPTDRPIAATNRSPRRPAIAAAYSDRRDQTLARMPRNTVRTCRPTPPRQQDRLAVDLDREIATEHEIGRIASVTTRGSSPVGPVHAAA